MGGAVGTDGRGGSAAGLSSSVCRLVICVHACCLCVCLSSVCVLIVCVCAHCPVSGHSSCVGGVSSLSKGGMSSVGGGRQLWALCGHSMCGLWLSFVGVGCCLWVLGCCLWVLGCCSWVLGC